MLMIDLGLPTGVTDLPGATDLPTTDLPGAVTEILTTVVSIVTSVLPSGLVTTLDGVLTTRK